MQIVGITQQRFGSWLQGPLRSDETDLATAKLVLERVSNRRRFVNVSDSGVLTVVVLDDDDTRIKNRMLDALANSSLKRGFAAVVNLPESFRKKNTEPVTESNFDAVKNQARRELGLA